MVVTNETILRDLYFHLNDDMQAYSVEEDDRAAMNQVVATESLKVTTAKYTDFPNTYDTLSESVTIRKAQITGTDIADALLACERKLRNFWGVYDPDHAFFEGFLGARNGDAEVLCWRWGS